MLHKQACKFAEKESVSINQMITLALAGRVVMVASRLRINIRHTD
jgi:predicted HicB family RNase H-like nuclease